VLKGGERLPIQRISCSGKIVPDVEAAPSAVQVGGRRIGETFEDEVVLRSLTGRSWEVIHAVAEGEGLDVKPVQGGGPFRIRQRVCREGSQANRILFDVHSEGRKLSFGVPVNYTAVGSD